MKGLLKLIPILLLAVSVVAIGYFAVRGVPYVLDSIRDPNKERRFELGKEKLRLIAKIVYPQPRLSNLNYYVLPMRGTYFVFEGYVTNSQDLLDLKDLVAKHAGDFPVNWEVQITNTIPAEITK